MKLSEAIMLGSVSTKQTYGKLKRVDLEGNISTCALGSALFAVGSTLDWSGEIDRIWPWASEKTIKQCPECGNHPYSAEFMIIHINDDHKWSRERIASWVASIEPATPEPVAGRDPEQTHQELCIVEEKV